jgi:hypothetical protein
MRDDVPAVFTFDFYFFPYAFGCALS